MNARERETLAHLLQMRDQLTLRHAIQEKLIAFERELCNNNRFFPLVQGNITEVEMWIFNRHGEQICYFKGPNGYWDGTTEDGKRCPQGVYVYVMRYRSSFEPLLTQEVKGTVTLLR